MLTLQRSTRPTMLSSSLPPSQLPGLLLLLLWEDICQRPSLETSPGHHLLPHGLDLLPQVMLQVQPAPLEQVGRPLLQTKT